MSPRTWLDSSSAPVLVNGTFGLVLSGPLSGAGTATTEPGGAIYSARDFQIVRLDSGVNIATHHFRVDLGLTSFLQWQNLLFVQNERSKSGPMALFFVPLPEGSATQYRIQSQLQFTF